MPRQAATIRSLPRAFEVMKGMQAQGLEWGEDYRRLGRQALAEILEGRMEEWLDQRLEELASEEVADRRNGSAATTWRVHAADTEANLTAAPDFDSGTVSIWPPRQPLGWALRRPRSRRSWRTSRF